MMSTSAEVSREPLPVCLFENSHRLVSLWDIVNLFNLSSVLIGMDAINTTRTTLKTLSRLQNQSLEEPMYSECVRELERFSEDCKKAQFDDSRRMIDSVIFRMTHSVMLNASSLSTELTHISQSVIYESSKRRFLQIFADRVAYTDHLALFGSEVHEAFPSARRDILEAGNTLSAECGTAAVFHLMRASEVALRCLARDRDVSYPHSSVDEQQCGSLISSLDLKLREMRLADKKLWPSEEIKNEQIRFYHRATIEFRSFNEAWRKHVCHGGADSFYDRHQALSTLEHVRSFMQVLSERISESVTTSEYWTLI